MVRTTTGAVWGKVGVSGRRGEAASLGGSVGSNGVLVDPGGLLSRPPDGVSWGGNTHVRTAREPDGVTRRRCMCDKRPGEEAANQNKAARSTSAPARATHGRHRRRVFPVYSAITSLAIFAEIRRW